MIALRVEPAVKRSWATLIVGVLFAFALVQWGRERLLINPEQAGLGTATSSVFGGVETGRVHCSDRRDEALCLAAYRKAGSPPALTGRRSAGKWKLPQMDRQLYTRVVPFRGAWEAF